jgi:hypothetical protein
MQTALVTSTSIAQVIQLSVAPVFLLTGVSGLLTVLTNRLGRIIDRIRTLEERHTNTLTAPEKETLELKVLARRAKWINRSISLCTFCALLICLVIATLFIADFLSINGSLLVAALFTTAMLSLTLGLLAFQREIYLAIRKVNVSYK